jgi:uncharacterized membrane protein (DUF485 family)
MTTQEQAKNIDMTKFKALVAKKWTISLALSLVMLVAYYGFILVLAFDKELMAAKIGAHLTLGIPFGIGVILLAFVLTGIYVGWANRTYDKAVNEILDSMRRL